MNHRNKTKIALVKPANEPIDMWVSWCDGLYGALKILARDFNIRVLGYSSQNHTFTRDDMLFQIVDRPTSLKYWIEEFDPKYVFGWGTSFHDWQEISGVVAEKILLYAGGVPDKTNAYRHFSKVVVENPSDMAHFDTTYQAFGTNTEYFYPLELNKLYPSFYPAAFAKYKRHDVWAKAMNAGSLAVGHMQAHEPECYEICIENSHIVMPTLPMNTLVYLYNQSLGTCLTPERMGGCQRAALESMACNVPVLVTNDSKASEFEGVWACPVDEVRDAFMQMVMSRDVNLREEFIIGKLDHIVYAQRLRELL